MIKLKVYVGDSVDDETTLDLGEEEEKGPGKGHSNNSITLSGKVLDKTGKEIGKSKFFDFIQMPLDKYDNLIFSYETAQRIKHHTLHMKHGGTAFVPIICFGPHQCKFVRRCPIWLSLPEHAKWTSSDSYPIGRACLMEAEFVISKLHAYCLEFGITPDQPSEMALISKLVELELYDYRASLLMSIGAGDMKNPSADGQDMMLEQVIAMDPDGHEIRQRVLHPMVELKEKNQRQRMDILTALVATRREKYKEKQALRGIEANQDAAANKFSDLASKLEKFREATVVEDDDE